LNDIIFFVQIFIGEILMFDWQNKIWTALLRKPLLKRKYLRAF